MEPGDAGLSRAADSRELAEQPASAESPRGVDGRDGADASRPEGSGDQAAGDDVDGGDVALGRDDARGGETDEAPVDGEPVRPDDVSDDVSDDAAAAAGVVAAVPMAVRFDSADLGAAGGGAQAATVDLLDGQGARAAARPTTETVDMATETGMRAVASVATTAVTAAAAEGVALSDGPSIATAAAAGAANPSSSARENGRILSESTHEPTSAAAPQASLASAEVRPNLGGDSSGEQAGGQGGASQNQGGASQNQSGADPQAAIDARTGAAGRAEQALAALAQVADGAGPSASTAPAAGGTATSAVAGRLSEVEASVARDRVVDSLEQGLLSIESRAGASGAIHQHPAMTIDASADASALSATSSDPAADLARPSLDPAPTGRLAAKGIDILSNQRGGAITMRLEPPALGQLRIELQISQGAVVADFTAATPEARVLLEANLGMLRERLESQGLAVERMTVHGGRGTEAAPVAAASHGSDLRQDANGSGADARDRGDRGSQQDAAGGESRGRREGEQGRERNARGERRDESAFLGMLEAQRAQDAGRRMRRAV